MKYLIVIEPTATGYSAYSPDLPGCIATGSTREEVEREMKGAVAFHLDGQDFVALNGGPAFNFTPAVSFYVACRNQEEVDYYWEKLTAGGAEERP